MQAFRAPWGWPLILVSAFSTVLLLGASGAVLVAARFRGLEMLFGLCPLLVLLGTLPFTVLGYRLESGRLYVQRLLWMTEVSLDGLQSVEVDPNAMKGSLRSFGNGGLFSVSGWYYSKALGKYRAWVTDLRRTVVLRFEGRAIVVSPDDPERFAKVLKTAKRL